MHALKNAYAIKYNEISRSSHGCNRSPGTAQLAAGDFESYELCSGDSTRIVALDGCSWR